MNEVIVGIRVIKIDAWEYAFKRVVEQLVYYCQRFVYLTSIIIIIILYIIYIQDLLLLKERFPSGEIRAEKMVTENFCVGILGIW